MHKYVDISVCCGIKGNLTKARAKLKYGAFIELNDHLNNFFYDSFQFQTWHGHHLFAVNGTTLRVPDETKIAEHFGVWNSTKGEKPCPKPVHLKCLMY